MNERHSLIAFLAVVIAIVALAIIAASNPNHSSTYDAAIVGLVGIAGSFRPKSQQSQP